MIDMVVNVGRQYGIPVDVCGEMASDPVCALVLMALGIERLSMAPHAIPKVKEIVRCSRMDLLRELGTEILEISTVEEIKQVILHALPRLLYDRDELIEELNDSALLAPA
jgi:phosphotransferase system enzyme I (PtsI)